MRTSLKCLVLLLCVISVLVAVSTEHSALRVIGGRDARPGEFPFVVHILRNKHAIIGNNITNSNVQFRCTGAAITSTWMITAAHCFTKSPLVIGYVTFELKFFIKYGDPDKKPSETNKISAVLKYHTPPWRRRSSMIINDDIGLAQSEPMLMNTFGKISSIEFSALYGQEVTLLGFGSMADSSTKLINTSYNLNKPLQVIDRALLIRCTNTPSLNSENPRSLMQYPHICVASLCGQPQTVYFGDSGGPAVHASGIIGVNIGLTDIALMQHVESMKRFIEPNIVFLTSVSPFLDWIHLLVTSESSNG